MGHKKDSAAVSLRLLEFRMHQDCRKILENLYLHIVHTPLSTWLGSLCKPEEVLFYPKVLPFGSQAASCGLKGLPSFLLCWLFLLGCQSLFFCRGCIWLILLECCCVCLETSAGMLGLPQRQACWLQAWGTANEAELSTCGMTYSYGPTLLSSNVVR